MSLEPLLKFQQSFTWDELASTLTFYGVTLLHQHEPLVRKYIQQQGYTIVGNKETLPAWKAQKPTAADSLQAQSAIDVEASLKKIFG